MKNKNLIYLLLAGYGLYLLLRKKSPDSTINLTSSTAPATPYNRLINTDPLAPENLAKNTQALDNINFRFALNGIGKHQRKIPNTI